jgi:hypothetical protein
MPIEKTLPKVMRLSKVINFIFENLELWFWFAGIVFLFFWSPAASHFTLCPISNLGLDFCPGCGLGHAIHYAMWLDFKASFNWHPLGIPALLIILHRIITLTIKRIKTIHHEHNTFTTHSGT